MAVAYIPATSVNAQLTGKDGITASPKVRQMLEERKTVAAVPGDIVRAANLGVTASPKLSQLLAPQHKVAANPAEISLTARLDDGLVASPKLRERLNSTGAPFQVAPIK